MYNLVECEDALIDYTTDPPTHYPVSMTVSGINKYVCIPYLLEKYGVENIFDEFDILLEIPKGKTGKNTLYYIDDEVSGSLIDYTGIKADFNELSSVYVEPTEYYFSEDKLYIDYLKGIQREVER